jgi:hypothetical protein
VDREALREKIWAEEKLASTKPPPAHTTPLPFVPPPPPLPRESSRPGPITVRSSELPKLKQTQRDPMGSVPSLDEEDTWDGHGDLPTLAPPERSTNAPHAAQAQDIESWPDLDDLPPLPPPPFREQDVEQSWTEDLPNTEPPPPNSAPLLERDRLLAAYLAEQTRHRPPSAPPSTASPRRGARLVIPREEPGEETLEIPVPEPLLPPDRKGRS